MPANIQGAAKTHKLSPLSQQPSLTKFQTIQLAIPGILLALVCLLPYLNKAYTIDDPYFLLSARQILQHPLQPMSFPLCWMGDETCLKSVASLGPGAAQALMGYLLVPVMLAGGAEWMAHLLQLMLACIAVLEMVRLALRLGFDRVQSLAAGLMLAAIPPFLSMANTAMPDIAAMTLGLTGIERLLAWKEERRWHQAALAALALGFAPYARPHLLLLIPLGALWLLNEFEIGKAVRQFRREAYLWAPVLIAPCILVAVNLVTRDHGTAYQSQNLLTGLQNLPRNFFTYLLYLSVPIPFAAVWLAVHWRRMPALLVVPLVLVLALYFALEFVRPEGRILSHQWPKVAALYGLVAFTSMLRAYLRARDRIGMLLSLWVLMPIPAVIYTHFPIKYMLAVLPAIVLTLIRTLSNVARFRELTAYAVTILICVAYSCVLLRADADFAEYGRRAAAELIAPHVAAGEKVWFGGEWGFYWYAEKAGARISKPGEPGPNPGELLAVGFMEGGQVTRDRFPKRQLIDSRVYNSPHGRTMGYGAGLYTNNGGYALWIWDPSATNTYELWRIQ